MADPLRSGDPTELSGMLTKRDDNVPSTTQTSDIAQPPSSDPDATQAAQNSATTNAEPREAGEEQALESHEVIELQLFSERKAWIEEKIQFLQNLPPVEVFAGLEAVRSSAEESPGLPTRAQLEQALIEHDAIEREIDVFDSGELRKLRNFTKAATQRNLSPEDTDLIELTLTTIYALDKLLHLLRDRSDSLDLLGHRLTWEEHRCAAWAERRHILADLETFLDTRARWSHSVYEANHKPEQSLKRKGSIASLASVASDTSTSASAHASGAFSRTARFKLAEMLSRDAAQFAGRVTSLRHGRIIAAGKALDKLIENSRKPVPDELLDEQDKLEEKGIHDMENIGKFAMNVVMQWRKADEMYVETMKDLGVAENVLDEIETAKLHHPTSRQSVSFVSRAEALSRRLVARGNPTSSASGLPCPVHPLFPQQHTSNAVLAQLISSEITSTMDVVKQAEGSAKEYRSTYEAVKHVEVLSKSAVDLASQFEATLSCLENGVPANDGDGTPPDLTSEVCLEPARHSSFLSLLPSLLEECAKTKGNADSILRRSRTAILSLDQGVVDSIFKADAAAVFQRLQGLRNRTIQVSDAMVARVDRLREVRKVWEVMNKSLHDLESIRLDVEDAMEKQRWRQQTGHTEAPPTPESPLQLLPTVNVSSKEATSQLEVVTTRVSQDINAVLLSMSQKLEAPLHQWLLQRSSGLKSLSEGVRQTARLLEAVRGQSKILSAVRDQYNDLQIHVEDLKLRFDSGMQDVLSGTLTGGALGSFDAGLSVELREIRSSVQVFIDGLSNRVPFVAQSDSASRPGAMSIKRRFVPEDMKLVASSSQVVIEPPFKLSSLDEAVRNDSNTYVMRLSGELQKLDQKRDHFQLARLAQDLDLALSPIVDDINRAVQESATKKSSLSACLELGNRTESLRSLSAVVDEFSRKRRSSIARSFSPIRDLLRRMDSSPGSHDDAVRNVVYLARSRAVDDAELKLNAWMDDVSALKTQILEAQRLEALRLKEEREKLDSMGVEVDAVLSSVRSDMRTAEQELHCLKGSLSAGPGQSNSTDFLRTLSHQCDQSSQKWTADLSRSISDLQALLARIDSAPGYRDSSGHHDPVARELIYGRRLKASEEIEAQFGSWHQTVASLQGCISQALCDELQKFKDEKKALGILAEELDSALLSAQRCVGAAERELGPLQSSVDTIVAQGHSIDSLQSLLKKIDDISATHRTSMQEPLSNLHLLLERMDLASGYHDTNGHYDSVMRDTLFTSRTQAVSGVDRSVVSWNESVDSLRTRVEEAICASQKRLQEEREQLARLQVDLDERLASTLEELARAQQWLETCRPSLTTILQQEGQIPLLQSFLKEVETLAKGHETAISDSFAPLHDLLCRLDTTPGCRETNTRAEIYSVRCRAVADAEAKFGAWEDEVMAFQAGTSESHSAALRRQAELERLRSQEEKRLTLLLHDFTHQSMTAVDLVVRAEEELASFQALFTAAPARQKLQILSSEVEEFSRSRNAGIAPLLALLHDLLYQLDSASHNTSDIYAARSKDVDSIELRFGEWRQDVLSLSGRLANALLVEARDSEAELAEHVELAQSDGARLEMGQQQIADAYPVPEPDLTAKDLPAEEHASIFAEQPELSLAEGPDEDVFGLCIAPSSARPSMTQDMLNLQSRILSLRRRLRAIAINEVARPLQISMSSSNLPTEDQKDAMQSEFSLVQAEVAQLPASAQEISVDTELRSLRTEMDASAELMARICHLVALSDAIQVCDGTCSDLLEHVDSYPSLPVGALTSSYVPSSQFPPEEQLSGRLTFTQSTIDAMLLAFSLVTDDARAEAEIQRVLQTWAELKDMAHDRINGRKSRPASVTSSGRSSSASVVRARPPPTRGNKARHYSTLSVGASKDGKLLPPARPTSRRAAAAPLTTQPPHRSPSRSSSSRRSVSGPFVVTNARLYSSTFASRQRTASLSSNNEVPVSVNSSTNERVTSRPRAMSGRSIRSSSPTFSEISSLSRSAKTPSRSSTTSTSTWARAPRQPFPNLPTSSPPRPRHKQPKKQYVANPKNKLDVAVGDVVNQLPVNINIEHVADTWQDQSGKYWIGDQDPKLCFCRILRSQTVMVRVGGGWAELSKFIKDHFADLFRLMPADMASPRIVSRSEKWISSATLLEAPEDVDSPQVPEPNVPIISLHTPSGRSPQSFKSGGSHDSPAGLTPLQFIRRADVDVPSLPVTPSKTGPRPRNITPLTPVVLRTTSPLPAKSHSSLQPSTPHTPARGYWRP